MAAIKQIKVGDVTYDIKAKQDVDGNDITTTYVKKDGEKVLSTEDFTTELKNKLDGLTNYELPAAGASIGGVKQGVAVADILEPASASSESIATSFNKLLASLRTAGVIAE